MNVIVVILFLFIIVPNSSYSSTSTLKLVHILFRHGAKTIDLQTRYPKDPHINETYDPYGFGQLTKQGKNQMYLFGKHLKKKYNHFLDASYFPHIVEGVSSDLDRCKASLQLVFAGLFPPTRSEVFETSLIWQPIPFSIVPPHKDLFFTPSLNCPTFAKLLATYMSSPEFQTIIQPDLKTFRYISKHTGLPMEKYDVAIKLQSLLEVENEWGLKLPIWTKPVYPEIIKNLTYKGYQLITATPKLKQIMSGTLLEKLMNDSKAKIDGGRKKIILMSGHDITIATLLISLDIYKPHLVKYGSHIVFELHKIKGVYGFKIYYKNGYDSHSEEDLVTLPNCEKFCSIEKFERITKYLMPTPGFCDGSGNGNVNSANLAQFGRFTILLTLFVLLIKL